MAENYFKKFQTITYANNAVLNIMNRTTIKKQIFNNPNLFYPYDIGNGVRPDQIADNYYNDQYMDWVLYLSNRIIDPYYGWYLNSDDFNKFVIKKYNRDIDTLKISIMYYTNNWYKGDIITTAEYDALPADQIRYWTPRYDTLGRVQSYERLYIDWTHNTNSIIKYNCNANNFINDEVVTIAFDANNKGKAQVLTANTTALVVQHVSGVLYPNTTVTITGSSYIKGRQSNANVHFTAVTSVANNISQDEITYWDPVSIYDFEQQLNEANKSINILNNRYSMEISKNLTDLMKNG